MITRLLHRFSVIGTAFLFIPANVLCGSGERRPPTAQKEIALCDKYRAIASWKPVAVWILKRPSGAVVAYLQGTDELDFVGNIGNHAVFSANEAYIAYSIGTASSGHELRLFRIKANRAERIPLEATPHALVNEAWEKLRTPLAIPKQAFAAHLYCTPVGISTGPPTLIFNLSGDYCPGDGSQPRFKTMRFEYNVSSHSLNQISKAQID